MSSVERGIFQAEVLDNRALSPNLHLVSFKRPAGFADTDPGGFVSIRVSESTVPLLMRPFSIMWQDEARLEILVKVVGPGSLVLSKRRREESVKILGPLGGRTFPGPSARPMILVAGGTGIAPIIYSIRKWAANGPSKVVLLYGGGTSGDIAKELLDEGSIEYHYATLDGSLGFEGDVVELFRKLVLDGALPDGDIYSCGPRGMIRALSDAARSISGAAIENFENHYTSLESVMACGLGACRGCTVPVKNGARTVLKTVCSDGPVFDADMISWEDWNW